ncbi:MAG: orotidine-5'-phosphate decarboxylase [Rikenellaceae bacterium]
MTTTELFGEIKKKGSFLCVGLDTDIKKIPTHLLKEEDPIFAFNKAIIDATAAFVVAYKPNLAFYEAAKGGWESYEKTVHYIKNKYPEILVIADAKRGDIGNTSEMYARAFFEESCVDAVTLSPYMGVDTAAPFLKYEGKWAVLLALTSNGSAQDFEMQKLESGEFLYEKVLRTASSWGTVENTMFVVGATKAEMIGGIRKIVPDHFLLVPGIGAQGGSLSEVAKYGLNKRCGLLVNSSRGIIYADKGEQFAEGAAKEAQKVQQEMKNFINQLYE